MWNDAVIDNTLPIAGCSWPIIEQCKPVTGNVQADDDSAVDVPVDATDPTIMEWSQQMAIDVMWAASGRQFGLCVGTFRPCRREACVPAGPMIDMWNLIGNGRSLAWDPWAGSLFAQIGCGCRGACRCGPLTTLPLWHRRVRQIIEVTIDGVVLPADAYKLRRLDGQWHIVRVDGGVWPECQDWEVDAGQVGSWTVKYAHGTPVPMGGRIAAGVLACEIALAAVSSEDCELPKRVRSVVRAGVSIDFLDPMSFLDQGRTGLEIPDMWLAQVNPKALQRRARVYRADDPRRAARLRR